MTEAEAAEATGLLKAERHYVKLALAEVREARQQLKELDPTDTDERLMLKAQREQAQGARLWHSHRAKRIEAALKPHSPARAS